MPPSKHHMVLAALQRIEPLLDPAAIERIANSDPEIFAKAMQDSVKISNGLSGLFVEIWAAFIDGVGFDGFELEKMLERTGLTEWREATEEDVSTSQMELLEVGDPIMVMTDLGKVAAEGFKNPA